MIATLYVQIQGSIRGGHMEYRFLGKTGMKVSALCLGSMTFGREATESESLNIMDRFQAAGGTFIDTANVYGRGVSERIVGTWLKGKRRDELVIATKVRWPMGDGQNEVGLSRKHILASVEASLGRLGTDYIDLYQVHGMDNGAPLEETLSTLHGLVQSGKVRYLGASNYPAWHLQKAIDLCLHHGWEPFICLQPLYNLLDRDTEWELLPVCGNEGLGVIPWSPLRGGWLSGKYHRGMKAPLPDTRIDEAEKHGWSESWSAYATERTWNVIDALLSMAAETGKAPAQVALRWLLQRPLVTAPIVGARTVQHLETNLGALGWSLTKDQMEKLDKASSVKPPYPISFLTNAARR
jgi:aryl-alcohol dehydrogenase-like predicted oxidoreductase